MSSTARRLAGAYSVDQAKVVPKEFLGNGYIKHTPALASTWRQIVEELPLPLHKHLIDICFVVLKPDALASNKGLAMWQKLIDHGLQPLLAWPCLDSGLRHFEELYKFNLTLNNNQCMLSSWWLHNQPYEMGPVIALLVRIPPEVRGDAAACDYFAHIKGPSNPFQAKPGQLRFDLVPTNMALNLLHSSDDPISCFREVRIFAPKSVVREGLLRAEQIESTAKDMVQVIGKAFEEFNIALRTVGYAEHDLDLVSTLVRLKLRLRLASRTEVGDLSS
ncbi:MAG: nucleoside-diphosphate kinase, partial [bacterium]